MGMNRALMFAGLGLAAAMAASPAVYIPEPEGEPGSARNRPSGNTPVSGGGKRERERRLARIAQQEQE